MLKNYLTIALRTLTKNKVYALINIFGLSLGITFVTLIYFFVDHELGYDRFHSKGDRIYRVIERDHSDPEAIEYYGQTSPAFATTIANEVPGVEKQIRVFKPGGHIDITWDGKKIHERSYIMSEENFFEVFDHEFIYGDPKTALKERNTIVLTESTSRKFFGDENPVGQTMKWENFQSTKVSAVIGDVPENSHMQYNVIFALNTEYEGWDEYLASWENYGAYTYFLLQEDIKAEQVEAFFPQIADKYFPEDKEERQFHLQALGDIYFHSADVQYGIQEEYGNLFYVNMFIGIAIFLLVVVSINYVNLSTAKSMHRAKEIGLRKVSGANKTQLMIQFLMEATLLSLMAFFVSLFLIETLLPYFNEVAQKNFNILGEDLLPGLATILGITLILGISSGVYPSIVLSRLKPVENLKGEFRANTFKIRSALLIVQFAIGIVMLVGAMVIYRQMDFIANKPLGFNQDNLLIVDINNRNARENFQTMKNLFAQVPGVTSVASSSRVPGEWKNIREIDLKKTQASMDSTTSYFMGFDEDMMETYGFELVDGENFGGNALVDSTKILINEAAAEALGLENPVGQKIYFSRNRGGFQIIGVVKDFHFQSLHSEIRPLVMGPWKNGVQGMDYFSLRLETNDFDETLEEITAVHDQFDQSTPIEYHFLDRQINNFYQNEKRLGDLFGIGAIIMLAIGGFGLFGITSYMMDRRKKEIGVRKVLGSTVVQLILLLYKTYGKQILIAFIVAAPLGYIFANQWTEAFMYKQEISPFLFLYAGVIVALFTMLTVSYKVVQSARLNPVDVLKDE